MAPDLKATPGAVASADAPVQWEARSARRVVEISRDQILERSRRIVDAAYELLESEGLEGLTIRAVLQKTRSEEHTSELQSLMRISYAVFCLKKKKRHITKKNRIEKIRFEKKKRQ